MLKHLSVIMSGYWFWLLAFTFTSCNNPRKNLIESAPLVSKTFRDDFGRTVNLRDKPKRIVSLAPYITETLFALGEGKSMAARSNLCRYPIDADFLPEVDIYPELDLSQIVTHDPDLVLASAEYHQPSMASFFERYNIPVIFLNPTSVATALSGIHLLGQIVDQEKRANYLVDSLAKKAIQISDSTQGQIKYKTAIVVSTDPIRVAGGGSFQQDFMKYAGAENVFAKLPARYPEISSEDLEKAAPEYLLFAMDDDQAYANLVAVAPELHLSLPAAQNKHVYQLEPELLMTPGPRLLEGIAYLIRILHARIQIDGILRPDF